MDAAIDSSALIFAFRIPALARILYRRYRTLLIPESVNREVITEGNKRGKKEVPAIEEALHQGSIRIHPNVTPLDTPLDEGERDALSLAAYKKIPLVCDDGKARSIGRALGVRVLPLTAILIWAAENKITPRDEALETLDELVRTGHHISPAVYVAVKDAINNATRH